MLDDPDTVRLPPAFTVVAPVVSTALKPFASVTCVVPPLTVITPVKSFAAFVRVIALLPAAILVVPPTVSAPLCVTAPPATMPSEATLRAGKSTAVVSTSVTFAVVGNVNEIVPPKELVDESSVTSALPVTARLPATVNVPESVMFPAAFTVTLPLPVVVTAPKSRALASRIEISLLPVVLSETAPVKSLAAFVKVIALLPAAIVVVPPTASAPLCVTAPVAVRSALPTFNVPTVVAPALVVSFDPVTMPDTVSVFPVAVSVVSPVVVNTAVVSRVFVN